MVNGHVDYKNKDEAVRIMKGVQVDYNKIAAHFSATRSYSWGEFAHFKPYLRDGQDILDLGCGNGRLARYLDGFKVNYLGADGSSELIKIAKEKVKVNSFIPDFRVGSFTDQYGSNNFDLIFMIAALQHVPPATQLEVLKNIYSQLKSGGKLLMTNWDLWQPRFWTKRLANIFLRGDISSNNFIISYTAKDIKVKRYYYSFNKRSIVKVLKQAGFTVNENFYCNGSRKTNIFEAVNLITIATK